MKKKDTKISRTYSKLAGDVSIYLGLSFFCYFLHNICNYHKMIK